MTSERRIAADRSDLPPKPGHTTLPSTERAAERIYLDFNASTPLAPEVVAAMTPYPNESGSPGDGRG